MAQIARTQPSPAPVGFLERLAAWVVDLAILMALLYFVKLLLGDDRPFFDGYWQSYEGENVHGGRAGFQFDLAAGNWVISELVFACYFIGSWCLFAATPGKLVLGQRIVSARDGTLVQGGAAVLRYVGWIIAALPLGLGLFWIGWDPDKEGWHDKIAQTRVVRAR